MKEKLGKKEMAVFGGGCFWCLEAAFEKIKGVLSVRPGYAGGSTENPTYEEVSGGKTGHAEVVEIIFDSSVISYEDLLNVFFSIHDPTARNRQGNDVGTQYRSIIMYSDLLQKDSAEKFIRKIDEMTGPAPIVTEIRPLNKFYPAEEYHRQYYLKNPEKTYCQSVIVPKLDKIREKFKTLLK